MKQDEDDLYYRCSICSELSNGEVLHIQRSIVWQRKTYMAMHCALCPVHWTKKNNICFALGMLSDCNFSFRCDVSMIHSEQGTENILSRRALCIRTNHIIVLTIWFTVTTYSMKRYKLNGIWNSFVCCAFQEIPFTFKCDVQYVIQWAHVLEILI